MMQGGRNIFEETFEHFFTQALEKSFGLEMEKGDAGKEHALFRFYGLKDKEIRKKILDLLVDFKEMEAIEAFWLIAKFIGQQKDHLHTEEELRHIHRVAIKAAYSHFHKKEQKEKPTHKNKKTKGLYEKERLFEAFVHELWARFMYYCGSVICFQEEGVGEALREYVYHLLKHGLQKEQIKDMISYLEGLDRSAHGAEIRVVLYSVLRDLELSELDTM